MQEASDGSRSESNLVLRGEDGNFEDASGIEQEWIGNLETSKKDLSCYLKSKNSHYYIISLANKSISLASQFDRLKVKFIESPSASGWTKKTTCIFPDHRDSSPSFGYNERENFFNCFGCGRAGGPVQLLAFLEGRELIDVAQEIMAQVEGQQNLNDDLDVFVQENLSTLKKHLFSFGELHYDFNDKHNFSEEACAHSSKIFNAFDFYVRNSIKNNSFSEEEMLARIKICKYHLDKYKS